MNARQAAQRALLLTAIGLLASCEEGASPFQKPEAEVEVTASSTPATKTTTAADIEAPDVFQAVDQGLWDGRPSLGGVWVAHSDVVDPERVMIRNEATGKTVVGALFRREREVPGPRIQVSSDAAQALGMLAGSPADLTVVALRREEPPKQAEEEMVAEADALAIDPAAISEEDPAAAATVAAVATDPKPEKRGLFGRKKKDIEAEMAAVEAPAPAVDEATELAAATTDALTEPPKRKGLFGRKQEAAAAPVIETATLRDAGVAAPPVVAPAVAPVAEAPLAAEAPLVAEPPKKKGLFGFMRKKDPGEPLSAMSPVEVSAQVAPAAAAPAAAMEKGFIQVATFSLAENADHAATQLKHDGIVPTVKEVTEGGKTTWRLLAGPATNSADRKAILKKVKALGFPDAYPVSG